jgi:tetratricopeptide (TPR) repeat protein
MKKYYLLAATILFAACAVAQVPYNSAVPNGYSKRATISEQVGLTEITISYHRPAVKGREGKIWGEVVHKGFINQGFGNGKPSPWRAGANENTTIEFDKDITVEGKPLEKGKYALFVAYDPVESIIIFSRRTDAWGSFFYDEQEDALRVKVMPQPLDKSVEYLKYEFNNQSTNAATIVLSWEKLSIPMKVEVDYLKQQYEAFVAESNNPTGFTSESLNIAAAWTLKNNYQLEKGLEWATLASGSNFPGNPTSFAAISTKAAILEKLGKQAEATATMKAAFEFASPVQLQQYGRQLLAAKKTKEAMEVFNFNFQKHPEHFMALSGMVRGLSASGEYSKALEFANKASKIAPNDQAKQSLSAMIEKLKAGKDVN